MKDLAGSFMVTEEVTTKKKKADNCINLCVTFILYKGGGDFNKYKLKCEERQLHLVLKNIINCSVKDRTIL